MGIIGEEFVLIRPESSGFLSSLKSKLTGQSGAFGAVGSALGLSVVVGAGAALLGLGEKFEKSRFEIQRETGLTGKALDAMFANVKSAYGQVPASLGQVTSALDLVKQRTGLLGPPMEGLGVQFLNLARITHTDVSTEITSATTLFEKYGISAKDMGPKLDVLFKASQQAGVGIDTIQGLMTKGGSVLQQYGFGFDESAALVANFAKVSGAQAPKALQALNTAFGKIAKEGKDPHKVLEQLIFDMSGGKPKAEAMAEAMKLLGARGGLELASAIQKGAFNLKGMLGTIASGKGGIDATSFSTLSLGDKFQILSHRAENALQPIASKLLDLVSKGFDKISAWFSKNGDKIRETFEKWKVPILIAAGAIALFVAPFTSVALGLVLLYNRSEAFRNAVQALGNWIRSDFIPAMQSIGRFIMNDVVPALQAFAGFMTGTVIPAVERVVGYVSTQFTHLVGAVRSRWNDIRLAIHNVLVIVKGIIIAFIAPIVVAWRLFHNQILGLVQAAWKYIRSTIQNALEVIRGIIDVVLGILSGHWSRAWDGIKEIFGGIWKQIVSILELAVSQLWAVIQAGFALLLKVITDWGPKVLLFFAELPGKIIVALGSLALRLISWALGELGKWLSDLPGEFVSIFNWFTTLPSQIITQIGNIAGQMISVGTGIVEGVIQGLGDFAGKLWDHMKSGLGGLVGKVKSFFGIGSPSKVFAEQVGRPIVDGIAMGIAAGAPGVGDAVHRAVSGAIPGRPRGGISSLGGRGIPSGSAAYAGRNIIIEKLVLAPTFPPGMSGEESMTALKTWTLETLADTFDSVASNGYAGAGRVGG